MHATPTPTSDSKPNGPQATRQASRGGIGPVEVVPHFLADAAGVAAVRVAIVRSIAIVRIAIVSNVAIVRLAIVRIIAMVRIAILRSIAIVCIAVVSRAVVGIALSP